MLLILYRMGLCTFQARRPQGIWQCRRRRQGQQGGTLSTLEVGRDESECGGLEVGESENYLVASNSIEQGPVDGGHKAVDDEGGEKDQPMRSIDQLENKCKAKYLGMRFSSLLNVFLKINPQRMNPRTVSM